MHPTVGSRESWKMDVAWQAALRHSRDRLFSRDLTRKVGP